MERNEFERHMTKLLNLLKKIVKHAPQDSQLTHLLEKQNIDKINLNLYFFNLLPMSPSDLDELESALEEITGSEDAMPEEMRGDFGWNSTDLDFLKQNGMTF